MAAPRSIETPITCTPGRSAFTAVAGDNVGVIEGRNGNASLVAHQDSSFRHGVVLTGSNASRLRPKRGDCILFDLGNQRR
jgi:hypothetical protein